MSEPTPAEAPPRRLGIVAAVAVSVLVLDQLTKWWALNELANGQIGYVPDRKALQEGSYGAAPGSTRCAPGDGEALVDSAVRQLLAHREIKATP